MPSGWGAAGDVADSDATGPRKERQQVSREGGARVSVGPARLASAVVCVVAGVGVGVVVLCGCMCGQK